MKLTILIENAGISEVAIDNIFKEIDFYKQHNSQNFDDIKFDIINSCLNECLIRYTNFDFIIEICNKKLGTYKYIFDMWLSELPKTYIAINKLQDFNWELIEQDYEFTLNFKYQDNAYIITLGEFETPEIQIKTSKQEVISIEVLKTEIDSARLVYYNYAKANLGYLFHDYLEMLDLSFDE